MPEHPPCVAAVAMQVRMQVEMPEVEVGGALDVASWAFTPARAATTATADKLLNIILLEGVGRIGGGAVVQEVET